MCIIDKGRHPFPLTADVISFSILQRPLVRPQDHFNMVFYPNTMSYPGKMANMTSLYVTTVVSVFVDQSSHKTDSSDTSSTQILWKHIP